MKFHNIVKTSLFSTCFLLSACQILPLNSNQKMGGTIEKTSKLSTSTIKVNNAPDKCNKSNRVFCTLSAAIQKANNANHPVTISLVPSSLHSLNLIDHTKQAGNGLPAIKGNIVIEGNGSTIERSFKSSTPIFRIFRIDKKGQLTLKNVVIRNGKTSTGYDGAGIWNVGTLHLIDSIVERNVSGDDGGGIRNDGILKISGSIIRRNLAKWKSGVGAGIQNMKQYGKGKLIVKHSAIINNTANGSGGGVWSRGTSEFEDTTISGNFSGLRGGGIQNYGSMKLTNTTVTDNNADVHSGGIYTFVPIKIANTILSGNHAQFSPDCSGIIESVGHNIIGNTYNCQIEKKSTSDVVGVLPKVQSLEEMPNYIPHHPVRDNSPAFRNGNLNICRQVSITYPADKPEKNCHIGTMNLPISLIGD